MSLYSTPEPTQRNHPGREKAPVPAEGTGEYIPHEAINRNRRQSWRALYLCMLVAFVVLAVLAHFRPYFPADLALARNLQSIHQPLFAILMSALSFIGNTIPAGIIVLLVATGFYLAKRIAEALFVLLLPCADLINVLTKLVVARPRPSPDLVNVANKSVQSGFPSGHVVHFVVFYGFLFYLAYKHLPRTPLRTAALVLVMSLIILIGPSRIYLGAHWPSDVVGGYLWGGLLLFTAISLYNWCGRSIAPRFGDWRRGAKLP